jgi:ribonuclease HI
MPWERRRYRGNKVWVEVGDDGAPALDARGLARLRYRKDDERTYSVRPAEIGAVDDPSGDDVEGPRPRKSARAIAPASDGRPPAEGSPPVDDDDFEPGDDVPALAGLAVHVYTDGASSGNPGPAGAGAVLLFREHKKELSRYLGETTNNVAELEAVLLGLSAVKNRRIPVRLHTDSSYVIGVLSKSMRAKANGALVARIREEMTEFQDLRLVKVAGHAGVEHNERADALARAEIRRHRRKPNEP